ncbi:MAG: PLD nuclease N-terminal domain-containing protein [Solibacillus sp.]
MENVNWLLITPLFILQIVLLIWALIDLRKITTTNGPKWIWAIIILFINTIGPILYFIFGRKKGY